MAFSTLKTIMDRAARRLSLPVPADWLTSADPNHKAMIEAMYETGDDLVNRADWSTLTEWGQYTVTGGNSSVTIPGASNFLRLTKDENAVFRRTPSKMPLLPMPSKADIEQSRQWSTAGSARFYRLATLFNGDQAIEFYPVDAADWTLNLSFISKYWIRGASAQATWTTAATDKSALPDRLIELGVRWRFRDQKGLEHASLKADYERQIPVYAAQDAPIGVVNFTGPGSEPQHPMRLPIPDYIPPA